MSGSGLKTTTNATVNGILSMEGTATASVAPTYGGSATLQYNTTTLRDAGPEWLTPFIATGGVVIANSGEITLNGAKVLNASVPLTINTGASLNTNAVSSYGLTLGGNFISNGILTANSSTITIAGTMASQNIGSFTTTGTAAFTKTAGTATLSGAINSGPFVLNGNGGILSTNSNFVSSGSLTLSANSVITLGASAHTISFANSSAATWTGSTTLTINGWVGDYLGGSGTAGRIFVGSDNSGLTAGQLDQIRFFNGASYIPAIILGTGEIVPNGAIAPSNLSYISPNTFTKNVAISSLNPIVTGTVTSFTVIPDLPAGLSLNPLTGVITGTPTTVTPTADYAITATNSFGSTSFDITITVQGTTFYSRATGNWNTNTTWSFYLRGSSVGVGIYPVAGDIVYIEGGRIVTVTANADCASITFPSNNGNNNTVAINTGITLTVSNAITIPRAGNGNMNQIQVGSGNMLAGSIAFTNGGGTNRHQVTISSGTVTVAGDITTNSTDISATILFTGAGTLRVGGQLMSSGTVGGTLTTFAGSTVEYNGLAVQTVKAVTYLGNLTLSGSGLKTTTGITVNGILTIAGDATASAVPVYGPAAGLVYNVPSPRIAGPEWPLTFEGTNGVVISNSGEITLNEAKLLETSVPLTINSGAALNTGGAGYGLTLGGNFVNSGTFTANGSPITISGAMVSQSIAAFSTTGTVTFAKASGIATLTGALNTGPVTLNGNGGTLNTGGFNINSDPAPSSAVLTLSRTVNSCPWYNINPLVRRQPVSSVDFWLHPYNYRMDRRF
ncbi:MAG: putative Ig domain-containing protein [Bacteroidales bacterium]|nr:putative Ig domain-containing protein [Bacteroidales bacterium]